MDTPVCLPPQWSKPAHQKEQHIVLWIIIGNAIKLSQHPKTKTFFFLMRKKLRSISYFIKRYNNDNNEIELKTNCVITGIFTTRMRKWCDVALNVFFHVKRSFSRIKTNKKNHQEKCKIRSLIWVEFVWSIKDKPPLPQWIVGKHLHYLAGLTRKQWRQDEPSSCRPKLYITHFFVILFERERRQIGVCEDEILQLNGGRHGSLLACVLIGSKIQLWECDVGLLF